ncbi:MAG TPA: class I SAM-dependent methyltransferase [Candidatus Paceibacterota bacterium]
MSQHKDHEKLYEGAHKGDTWTLPEDFDLNPRGRAVEMVRSQFEGPVAILDIGCGKAINTKWVADQNDGSTWTGVDVVAKEKIGLKVEDDATHTFLEGDFTDPEFREKNKLVGEKFDIITDQGATFIELDDSQVEDYLKLAHSLLKEKGIFLVLTLLDKPQVVIFADGRKRVIRSIEDFQREPFSKYFEIEDAVKENPFAYAGHTYLPEGLYPGIKNPLPAKVGEELQLQVASIPMKKKTTVPAK